MRIFHLPLLLPDVQSVLPRGFFIYHYCCSMLLQSMYTDMCLRLQDQVERARAQARVRKQEREDRELRQVGTSSIFFSFIYHLLSCVKSM